MTAGDASEPDRVASAPHPRHTTRLLGQAAAEAAVLDAVRGDRLHHAWLLTGPRGVGKATLAWRIARFLLATPARPAGMPDTLDVPKENPVARTVAALSEPRLFLLRRAWDGDAKRLKAVITVDEVRRMKNFFNLSAADAGRRVVVVDAADEMNNSAANALLKVLEEPPANTTLLLVSHATAGLLPTIRSRCRELRCRALSAGDLEQALAGAGVHPGPDAAALAELSGGSVGEALRLVQTDGIALYRDIVELLATTPRLDRAAALALASAAAGRENDARYDTIVRLIETALARLARAGAGAVPNAEAAPGEAEQALRLSPSPDAARAWATLHQSLAARGRHGRAVNLDPQTLLLDTVLKINETAAGIARRRDHA